MDSDEDETFADAKAVLFAADRELGRQAFEIAIAPRFPEFTELVHVGVGQNEPHLIYRGDESFLIVETEVSDPQEKRVHATQRKLPDGRSAELGTCEYLRAGLDDALQRTKEGRSLIEEIIAAVSENRIRYVLVTVKITGDAGNRECESVKLAEFEL